MTQTAGQVAFQTGTALIGSLDASAQVKGVAIDPKTEMRDRTTFADQGFQRFVPAIKSATWTVTANGDSGSGTIGTYILNNLGNNTAAGLGASATNGSYPLLFTVRDRGTAIAAGDTAWIGRGLLSGYSPTQGNVGDLWNEQLTFTTDYQFGKGVVLEAGTSARTGNQISPLTWADWTLGGVNVSGGDVAGWYVYAFLAVTAASGTLRLTATIQQATDNVGSGAADLFNLTQTTAATQTFEFARSSSTLTSTNFYGGVKWSTTGSGSITFVLGAFILPR
jgi:hypothetical protein